jgi:hypothetical protein
MNPLRPVAVSLAVGNNELNKVVRPEWAVWVAGQGLLIVAHVSLTGVL